MSTSKLALLLIAASAFVWAPVCRAQSPHLGRPLTPDEIQKADITVAPDGKGLPREADRFRRAKRFTCKSARRATAPEAPADLQDQLTGGIGTLTSAKPVKTPVSFWPAATTLFDYIRRSMPITTPQTLTNDEVYAVTAYILSIDGIVPANAVLDAKSLPQVKMPNRDGFVRWWPVPKH